jgi:hypothetical protein
MSIFHEQPQQQNHARSANEVVSLLLYVVTNITPHIPIRLTKQ